MAENKCMHLMADSSVAQSVRKMLFVVICNKFVDRRIDLVCVGCRNTPPYPPWPILNPHVHLRLYWSMKGTKCRKRSTEIKAYDIELLSLRWLD